MDKSSEKKAKKVVKGGSSGLVISIAVHAAAFFLAGLLVVFTVQNKEEIAFEPPQPVERPKMKLKKPKVKVKKNTKPKSSSRIVTKVNRASMPDIQLPEMSGMGDGLAGGLGGFDIGVDIGPTSSLFGEGISTGNDLKGRFIDFKRGRSGRNIPMSPDQLETVIYDFMKSGWKSSKLAKYYRSPRTLYSPTVCVPTVQSEIAPRAFGEMDTIGYCWAVLYEGSLVYPEDITFRFWGVGDKFMGVYVDGETVFFDSYYSRIRAAFANIWTTNDPKDETYYFGQERARPSDWITLKANEPQDIKVILGDLQGGLIYHMLSVEVKGEEYPNTRAGGGPTFPVFRVAEIQRDVQDEILKDMHPGDLCLTNGPIFRDFVTKSTPPEPMPEPPPVTMKDLKVGRRVWTSVDGKEVDAKFRTLMGAKTVVFERDNGKQIKFPLDQLIAEDQELIGLINPPDFDINWRKTSDQAPNPTPSPYVTPRELTLLDYTFGVGIEQTSVANRYSHELEVEYFAIGEEIKGDNYILLERNTTHFNPADYRGKVFEFYGKPVRLQEMAYRDTAPVRGTKYGGFIVTITDKKGDLIAYKTSNNFLFEKLHKLRLLKARNYFNRNVDRVTPTQPSEDNRGNGAINGTN